MGCVKVGCKKGTIRLESFTTLMKSPIPARSEVRMTIQIFLLAVIALSDAAGRELRQVAQLHLFKGCS